MHNCGTTVTAKAEWLWAICDDPQLVLKQRHNARIIMIHADETCVIDIVNMALCVSGSATMFSDEHDPDLPDGVQCTGAELGCRDVGVEALDVPHDELEGILLIDRPTVFAAIDADVPPEGARRQVSIHQ